jgi:uncharacterized protein (TIGR03118 family)
MFTDTNLAGAWGVARSPTSPWWVNSTVGGVSLVFNGAGEPFPTNHPLVVTVPPAPSSATAILFNGAGGFEVESNKSALFIFATLNGTISGWGAGQSNPLLAVQKVDEGPNASYTGLTVAPLGGSNVLYAANYAENKIEAFDQDFKAVTLAAGAFADPAVPAGLSVFNVQRLGGDRLFVTYAPTNAFGNGTAAGLGQVNVFDSSGRLQGHLRWGLWMNAPWAVTLAPTRHGRAPDHILVGMFGSGQIAMFGVKHGHFRGMLQGTDHRPITIGKGLWGLGFGNGANAGPSNTLYFATDVVTTNGFHGIFGALKPVTPSGDDQGEDENDNDQH